MKSAIAKWNQTALQIRYVKNGVDIVYGQYKSTKFTSAVTTPVTLSSRIPMVTNNM